MARIVSAIIFCNNDLSTNVQAALVRQLFIDEVMDGYEFDDRIAADPNYPATIQFNKLKILVVRPFTELTNRTLADVVIFVKAGLAAIELSKYGPPGRASPVDRLTLAYLFRVG